MYELLDTLFVLAHTSLVVFVLAGWVWADFRRIHLVVISLTLFSWFGLGILYGWGYCPFTDWHWQVKRKLGEGDLPASYVKYYADRITGLDLDPGWVDTTVAIVGVSLFVLSAGLNWRDLKRSSA